MGCAASTPVSCPRCKYKFINGEDFLYHLEIHHNLKECEENLTERVKTNIRCPKCCRDNFKDGQDLVKHLEENHSFLPGDTNATKISCPKCSKVGFKSTASLVRHCDENHSTALVQAVDGMKISSPSSLHNKNMSLPHVGDRVLAMWVRTQWQYFDATIIKFMPDKLRYEIEWDDQDASGRIVDYFNLALNKAPNENEIGIGSIVLFHQGRYKGQDGVRLGGVRWHQGRITHCHTRSDGVKLYDGCHTKGAADGKWVTYKDYCYEFKGYEIDELRVGPNVFDIIESDNDNEEMVDNEHIDIYFSYTPNDSPFAIKNKEVQKVPERYLSVLDKLCDPRKIADELKLKGLKIAYRNASSNEELKKTAKMMKKAKVFIACISDEYVADNECRMEFQYAKTTLNTPIVPLVVGDGSFEWTFSVVGMLIAGELYIHFKDKSVENAKFSELFTALNAHFDNITSATDSNSQYPQIKGPADIFISYCWTNSLSALQSKQINEHIGHELSDPRYVKKELENAGYKLWLDIERLRSANASASMYEQLTEALKEAKVVVPFVSMEYANSPNCRLEFQFAMKSLGKPIIPVIVGKGDEWRESVIGALVAHNDINPINVQNATEKSIFDQKLQNIKNELEKVLGAQTLPTFKEKEIKRRAPKEGDHVVCHHFKFAYYMATVVGFNTESLEYTVNWDDLDPSGRVQPYNQVALDVVPDSDEIGVGTVVFFQQGFYGGTEGNNSGGKRYHEGIITSSKKEGGLFKYSGHHTRGEDDGKWVTYRDYSYEFSNVPLEELRIAPSAMDALLSSQT